VNIDLRTAINTISDVVQNRPPPIREVDQIYMKVADMAIQAEFVARRFNGMDVAFVGDGDGISLCVAHLRGQGVIDYAPKSIHVLDFDQRIVKAVMRFADHYRYEGVTAELYNVADPLPPMLLASKGAFYTNPPWGASNDGESVLAFLERGIEACGDNAVGIIVIADDAQLPWTQRVLRTVQSEIINAGFLVAEMLPEMHYYHLDDNPELRSCSLVVRRVEARTERADTKPLDTVRLKNFYGRNNPLRYKYILEQAPLNYGKAPEALYRVVPLEVK
jgi:N4-bis(aminopropyl)spermidine synthase